MDFAPFLTRIDYLAISVDGKPEPFDVEAVGDPISDLLEAHVAGGDRFGVYTPDQNGMTRWACLDIDGAGTHKRGHEDPEQVVRELEEFLDLQGLVYYRERSNSGSSYHLWIFFDRLIPAADIRAILCPVAEQYTPKVEVYPKRDGAPKKTGNLVWLPWWGRSKFCRLTDSQGRDVRNETLLLNKPPASKTADSPSTGGPVSAPHKWKPVNWTLEEAALALEYVDPDLDYDTWNYILCGLKYAFGDEGYGLAKAWSESAEEKWDEHVFEEKWREWDRTGDGGTRTHATIIRIAKENGWVPPSTVKAQPDTRYTIDGNTPREIVVPTDTSDLSCARAILENLGWPHGALDQLWRYSEDDGIWSPINEEELFEHVESLHNLQVGGQMLRLGAVKIKNILKTLELATNANLDWPEPATGIAFRNGFLSENGLVPHSPEHWCRHFIDEDFDPDARNEVWEQFLVDCFADKEEGHLDAEALQEFTGCSMMGTAVRREQILFLKGGGGVGKSTILDTFSALFPESAKSHLMPQRMVRPENVTPLFHSRVNIVDDFSGSEFRETGMFKSAVSGKPIEGRNLYKTQLTFRPKAAWIISGNRRPDTKDGSSGFFRRWLIITCTNKPESPDIYLFDKIRKAGLGGVAAWAWRGFLALNERGPSAAYTEPSQHRAQLDEWQEANSSLIGWALDCLEPSVVGSGDITSSTDLYRSYSVWMHQWDPDGDVMSLRKFAMELDEQGFARGRTSKVRGFECRLKKRAGQH